MKGADMSRPRKVRRFEPRYGVSQAAVEIESTALQREIEDHAVLSHADIQSEVSERYQHCKNAWEHFQHLLRGVPQRERNILQLSLIHISEPTRQAEISYAVFCLKKKK